MPEGGSNNTRKTKDNVIAGKNLRRKRNLAGCKIRNGSRKHRITNKQFQL